MAEAPGFVMKAPGEERTVWVRSEDRAAWEKQGYTVERETGGPAEEQSGAEGSSTAADSAPDAALIGEATDEPREGIEVPLGETATLTSDEGEPAPEIEQADEPPKQAVTYPRSRGRNSAPRG